MPIRTDIPECAFFWKPRQRVDKRSRCAPARRRHQPLACGLAARRSRRRQSAAMRPGYLLSQPHCAGALTWLIVASSRPVPRSHPLQARARPRACASASLRRIALLNGVGKRIGSWLMQRVSGAAKTRPTAYGIADERNDESSRSAETRLGSSTQRTRTTAWLSWKESAPRPDRLQLPSPTAGYARTSRAFRRKRIPQPESA